MGTVFIISINMFLTHFHLFQWKQYNLASLGPQNKRLQEEWKTEVEILKSLSPNL